MSSKPLVSSSKGRKGTLAVSVTPTIWGSQETELSHQSGSVTAVPTDQQKLRNKRRAKKMAQSVKY